ncbi:hypothetical protein RFI_00949 [Reticulomyxa filosa]|uniref:Uncharacterized protein n=1 Tax=Reticulomyxa filosa TaxID=46433 RepID=X6PEJ1_RETFI|nr:hypothetical protein RFI_00949 [Reticulomyxa filosa]|eukprot:ETO36112.1 hypothetical protein RFI_00949 [Reticulomyxa filosa]
MVYTCDNDKRNTKSNNRSGSSESTKEGDVNGDDFLMGLKQRQEARERRKEERLKRLKMEQQMQTEKNIGPEKQLSVGSILDIHGLMSPTKEADSNAILLKKSFEPQTPITPISISVPAPAPVLTIELPWTVAKIATTNCQKETVEKSTQTSPRGEAPTSKLLTMELLQSFNNLDEQNIKSATPAESDTSVLSPISKVSVGCIFEWGEDAGLSEKDNANQGQSRKQEHQPQRQPVPQPQPQPQPQDQSNGDTQNDSENENANAINNVLFGGTPQTKKYDNDLDIETPDISDLLVDASDNDSNQDSLMEDL